MKLIYSRPILKDLSQGSRLAFVRQFRTLSQDEVAKQLGATGENRRRTVTRYEKGDRNPEECRTKKLAEILDVKYEAIKRYDYKSPIDIIYTLLWLEELYPNYHIDLDEVKSLNDENINIIKNFLYDWELMKVKRKKKEIRYSEYIEWKINFSLEDNDHEWDKED